MTNAHLKIVFDQMVLAAFFLLAFAKTAPAQSAADARALERLKWMRQDEPFRRARS